jgi:hypothetical protein
MPCGINTPSHQMGVHSQARGRMKTIASVASMPLRTALAASLSGMQILARSCVSAITKIQRSCAPSVCAWGTRMADGKQTTDEEEDRLIAEYDGYSRSELRRHAYMCQVLSEQKSRDPVERAEYARLAKIYEKASLNAK